MQSKISEINRFLISFGHITPIDDFNYLKSIKERLIERDAMPLLYTTNNGTHYINCEWSDENCTSGPETCGCNKQYYETARELMQKYLNFYNVNRSDKFILF